MQLDFEDSTPANIIPIDFTLELHLAIVLMTCLGIRVLPTVQPWEVGQTYGQTDEVLVQWQMRFWSSDRFGSSDRWGFGPVTPDGQTDRKQYIRAHRAYAQVCSKNYDCGNTVHDILPTTALAITIISLSLLVQTKFIKGTRKIKHNKLIKLDWCCNFNTLKDIHIAKSN